MSDTLTSSMATAPSNVQPTYTASAPITIPSIDQSSGMVVGAPNVTDGVAPNSMLGVQSEVATQIQNAMAGIQGQLMGHNGAGNVALQGNSGGQIAGTGQNEGSGGTSSIPDTMIAQGASVSGDAIQDSIQDSILGQTSGGGIEVASAAAILGQTGGGQVTEGGTGMPDSNQYLNPTVGAIMSDSPTVTHETGTNDGPTSVSDITTQLINQYVASTRPAETTVPPSYN